MLRRPTHAFSRKLSCQAAVLLAGVAVVFSAPQAVVAQQITPESLIGSAVSQPDSSKYGDVSQAIRRFTNKDVQGAQLLLEQAKRKNPKLPPVAVMLADMYRLSGNAKGMRTALEQSVTEAPDDPEPYLMLAEQALNGNRSIEADALFDRAVGLIDAYDANPKRKRSFIIRAYRGRAVVDQRRRKWEQAEADLRAWIKEDPENAVAHNRLGSVLFRLDKKAEGLRAFADGKKLDDSNPDPYVTAGAVLMTSGETDEALKYFTRAYKADDKNERNITQLANALLISDDVKNASEVIKRGMQAVPESFNLHLLGGAAARMQGDNEQAEKLLLQAAALQPSNRDVLLQLTYIFAERGDEESLRRAQRYALVNAKVNENHPDALVALAWVLDKSKQPQQANAALQKVTQTNRLSPEGKLIAAKMLLARKQPSFAKQLLSSATQQPQSIFIGKTEAEELLAKLN